MEYRVQTGKAGKWKVEAEVAAPAAAQMAVKVGESAEVVAIPATGEGLAWKAVPFGVIELPKEEAVIVLQPEADHWSPIQLRKVTLTPVDEGNP